MERLTAAAAICLHHADRPETAAAAAGWQRSIEPGRHKRHHPAGFTIQSRRGGARPEHDMAYRNTASDRDTRGGGALPTRSRAV